MLRVTRLKKNYGHTRALDGVDLLVHAGERVALLGPNGAGKTTLFRLLTALELPDAGEIRIVDDALHEARCAALARIGVVFQQPTIDLDISVFRNLHYHALLHGIERVERKARIAEVLHEVQLGGQARSRVRTLSGGNRRRVELARALLHRPRLLLMDEPTVGLDPESRADLLKRTDRLRREQGVAVLWATHLVDEAGDADRVIVLHHGRVLAAQPPAQLLARTGTKNLGDAFLALTGTDGERELLQGQLA